MVDRSSARARWTPWIIAVLGAVALAAALYGHALPGRWVLSASDAAHMYVPIKERTALALARGELPLWNESVGCGVPFLANPMVQALYPGNLLFLAVDPVLGLKLFLISHLVFAALAFRVLAREFGVHGLAATLGGLLLAGSGAVVSLHWNLLWMAGLPWTLLAMAQTRRVLHGERPGASLIGLAVCVLLTALACAFELIVFFGWFALAECALAWFRRANARDWFRRAAALAVAAAIAVGLSACQLLPTVEMVAESSRAAGVGRDDATIWSTAPLRLLELVAPSLFGSPASGDSWSTLLLPDMPYHHPFLTSLYLGAPAITLAILGFLRAPRGTRLLLGGAAIVTALLALGGSTPFFELARAVVPGVGFFRYPSKTLACTMIPVCLLASLGCRGLLERGGTTRAERSEYDGRRDLVALWTVPVVIGIAFAALLLWHESAAQWIGARTTRFALALDADRLLAGSRSALLIGAGAASAFALLVQFRRRMPTRLAAGLLVVLPVADVARINRELITVWNVDELLEPPPSLPPPDELSEPSGRMRVASVLGGAFQHFYEPYHASLHGYRACFDYTSLDLRTHRRFQYATRHRRDRQLALASARLRLTTPPDRVHKSAVQVERLPDSLPRASLVPLATVAVEEDAAVWYLGSEAFDPRREVVLVGAPTELGRIGRGGPPAGSPGTVVMTRDDAGVVEMRLAAERDAFLLLTDSWYPGWQAYLDGRPVPHYRANVAFRALPVPAGDHEVTFRFEPASVAWGFAISGLTVAGVLIGVGIGIFRARRRRQPGAELRPERPEEVVVCAVH